jgi:D-beta-D-heptose 7-phosphate kinase / D-beta-D-heptose 1-phosphate adenosyltransferase
MIATWDGLTRTVRGWKEQGFRVGFTNGCFSILHVGHLATLAFAARHADRLIVGIDDDDSVVALKGPTRLIMPANERALIVNAIRRVDMVTVFGQGELDALVAAVKPDIMVKGEEYRGSEVVGARHAKQLLFAPMLDGISTTRLIERILGEEVH